MALSDYHLFQIPIAIREYDETIGFTTLDNDLSDGYESGVLFGSANGVRRFRIGMPTLTGSSMDNRTATTINGETTTYENYVWDLYCETKVTGRPFAFQSRRHNQQYYLVKFADPTLSYSRLLTKLYSTGVELKQVRIPGETVYNIGQVSNLYDSFSGGTTTGVSGTVWTGAKGVDLQASGGVANIADGLGTHTILRFDGVDDFLNDGGSFGGLTEFYEAFLVMKMREATFSNNAGVLTRLTSSAAGILVGDAGTNHFYNFGAGVEYELNGVAYPESNMVAPMNEWGIVRVRSATGSSIAMDGLQVGKDRGFAGRYAKMDLAALAVFSSKPPTSTSREIYEFLAVEYGVTGG